MRILITGASGFIGRHLRASLAGKGNQIIALSCGISFDGEANVVVGPAKLADLETWDAWPPDIGAVVHLAAKLPENRGANGSKDGEIGIREANVDGTRALAKRARSEGVRRLIFLSTANVHGSGRIKPYGEDDTLSPPNLYARTKRDAETVFWESLGSDREMGVVLRPPPVFGLGGHGPIAKLVKLARIPCPLPLEGLGAARSIIAVDHLAEIIELCLTSEAVRGGTFLVADDGPLTPADIVRSLRRGWGRSHGLLPAPAAVLEWLAAAAGKSEQWRNLTAPFVLDTRRFKDMTGWHPTKDAAAKLIEMASMGAL